MSRALYFLANAAVRERVAKLLATLPDMTRVEFKDPKRTLPQNDRMWAMLTEISTQVFHHGRQYAPEEWKCIFLDELGREAKFVPSLYGEGVFTIGQSSSDLSKEEMSDMIELMFKFGAENGIKFKEPTYQDPREAA